MADGAIPFDWLARSTGALEQDIPGVVGGMHVLADVISMVAILVMVAGTVRFVFRFVPAEFAGDRDGRARALDGARVELGRYILAGLEVLIVSDIIHTAVSLAFGDLVFLGLLVIIRIAISYFLDREIAHLKRDTS